MLNPLYIAVSWVLLRWHQALTAIGLDGESGVTWALSIFLLVVTIRILLFRFFIKQVHTQRKTQEMQPKIQALREKYKNDRQTLSQEMLKLQREEGFNPLAGCLPILLQAPVFLALFHVLRLIGTDKSKALWEEYHWTESLASDAGQATLFHAPIAADFNDKRGLVDKLAEFGATTTATRIIAFTLIVAMVAATYITQRQIMARNKGQVVDGQQAMIQKLLLYGMPASLFVSGFFFPIGVLLYWFSNNLWTMGQQFYILKRMPHPSTDKPERDPAVAKALAPKPGQKPVNPRKRPAAGTTPAKATDATADGAADAAANDAPTAKATGTKGTPAKAAGKKPPGKATPAKQPPKDADAADAEGDATEATAEDGANGSTPKTPAAGGGTTGSRQQRRPPNRRTSTTTRPKKKRR